MRDDGALVRNQRLLGLPSDMRRDNVPVDLELAATSPLQEPYKLVVGDIRAEFVRESSRLPRWMTSEGGVGEERESLAHTNARAATYITPSQQHDALWRSAC